MEIERDSKVCVSAVTTLGPFSLPSDKRTNNNYIDENVKMQMQPIIVDFTRNGHFRVVTVIAVIRQPS